MRLVWTVVHDKWVNSCKSWFICKHNRFHDAAFILTSIYRTSSFIFCQFVLPQLSGRCWPISGSYFQGALIFLSNLTKWVWLGSKLKPFRFYLKHGIQKVKIWNTLWNAKFTQRVSQHLCNEEQSLYFSSITFHNEEEIQFSLLLCQWCIPAVSLNAVCGTWTERTWL